MVFLRQCFSEELQRNTVVDTQLDGLEPSEMIHRAFELQFQIIHGLAERAFEQRWWNVSRWEIQPPPNRVDKTDHSVTVYANDQVYSMSLIEVMPI